MLNLAEAEAGLRLMGEGETTMNNMPGYEAAQRAWENMTPPENDGWEDYMSDQVELLLDVEDGRDVKCDDFMEWAGEELADRQDELVQLVLAVYRGRAELVETIGNRLGKQLEELAERMVAKAVEDYEPDIDEPDYGSDAA